MKDKKLFFSNFIIKIIALIAMTIDHIGVIDFFNNSTITLIFRIIGRISLPLFIFLEIEGLSHTHNIKKYLLRLGVMAFIIYLVIGFINTPLFLDLINANSFIRLDTIGNIFLTLFLLALIYYLFTLKNKYLRLLGILPILFFIGLYIVKELSNSVIPYTRYHFLWDGLYPQYELFALILFGAIYLAYFVLDKLIIESAFKRDESLILAYKNTTSYQFNKNIAASIAIFIFSLILSILASFTDLDNYLELGLGIQSYMFLSIIFILFYNGKLGYKNKYLQGAFYLYYPLHIVIIFLIYLLISM